MKQVYKTLLLSLMILGGSFSTVTAQEMSEAPRLKSQWSAELGYRSGVAFEHPLGKHFSMRYNVGILAHQRIQPYQTAPKKVAVQVEYGGLMPFITLGTRWYPKPQDNNSGFYLGLDLQYNHNKWKFAIDPNKDVYELEHEGLIVLNIGYTYNIYKDLNLKAALLPTIGAGFADKGQTVYGTMDLRYDIGVTYSF